MARESGEQAAAIVGALPVAIYTRVSTDNQTGGRFDSCESQAAICREQITRRSAEGWHEVACFTDAAYSGSTMNRPGIRALKRMIEAGEVKVVLIYKLERVLRSTDEWIPFRGFLQKHGCRLESATEDLSESTPSGRLKNNLLMSVAEYERLNTAEKTRAKMHEQAKRGLWNGGNVPFGYVYDKNTQTLQPHPVESALITRIFEQAAKLVTLQGIANSLNVEGLRTKERIWRRRDGTARPVGQRIFRSDGLRIILKNPLYRGAVRFGGHEYPAKHPPLVSADLWEKANAAIAPVNQPPVGRLQARDVQNHLLKGLVHCGCCQRRLVPTDSTKHANASKVYRYYACGTLLKERQPCRVGRLSADALEKVVVTFLTEISRHPAVASAALQHAATLRTHDRPGVVAATAAIQKDLDAVNKRLRHCLQTVEAGGSEVFGEELRTRVTALRAERDRLVVQRERQRQLLESCDARVVDEKRITQSLERLSEILPKLPPAEVKQFVHLFVERLELRPVSARALPGQPSASRILEIRLRLHVPRLVEGMNEKAWLETRAQRLTSSHGRSMDFDARVDFTRAKHGEVSIIAPFSQSVRVGHSARPAPPPATSAETKPAHHPIHTSFRWQKMLEQGAILNRAALARKLSVTRAGITQHLQLLQLRPEIQQYLTGLRTAPEVHHFSMNRMRGIARLAPERQLAAFTRLRKHYIAPRIGVV